ncbi:hypothetical protein HZS_5031 [Henneguya salminicola]|nr:hypothetical protein HZS_5031 [Henneguya salminicola]
MFDRRCESINEAVKNSTAIAIPTVMDNGNLQNIALKCEMLLQIIIQTMRASYIKNLQQTEI